MRFRAATLMGPVLAVVFGLVLGCQPQNTQRDVGEEAVEGRDSEETSTPPQTDLSDSNPDSDAKSSGINVDIGGGEGVDVDVNLPSNESKEGQQEDKGGIQVDVGDGAVDVNIGSESGKP